MSRMNGQLTWITPVVGTTAAPLGDDANGAAGTVTRVFVATERCTVVEVGAIPLLSSAVIADAFAFTVSKRIGGVVANDTVIHVWTSVFAAEGGVSGDPSTLNFNFANEISSGIISAGTSGCPAGSCLRAYTETTLDKGDMLAFKITTANGTACQIAWYAKVNLMGAGLVESNDVDPA